MISPIKNIARRSLELVVVTSLLVGIAAMNDYGNARRRYVTGYSIIESKINSNIRVYKKVQSINHEYISGVYEGALLHWFDPQVTSNIKFDDGSSVKLRYSLFDNISYFKRKIISPNSGDSCVIDGSRLRVLR